MEIPMKKYYSNVTQPTAYDTRLNEKCISLDLENLHEMLQTQDNWINIQPALKQGMRHLLNITV